MNQTAPADDSPSLYTMIGGEKGLRRLVNRFYDIMDRDPAAQAVRALHDDNLHFAREKLFDFLSGWLGGPRRYTGCVVGAHRRMAIGVAERDQWLACMDRALAETHPHLRPALKQPFTAIADIMRNR